MQQQGTTTNHQSNDCGGSEAAAVAATWGWQHTAAAWRSSRKIYGSNERTWVLKNLWDENTIWRPLMEFLSSILLHLPADRCGPSPSRQSETIRSALVAQPLEGARVEMKLGFALLRPGTTRHIIRNLSFMMSTTAKVHNTYC